jgi:hypothetical protein
MVAVEWEDGGAMSSLKEPSALLNRTANAQKNGVNLRFAGVKGWRKGL